MNLEIRLRDYFDLFRTDRDIYEGIRNGITGRMSVGKFAEFYNGEDVIVNDEELYWMAKLFMKMFKDIPEEQVEKFNLFPIKLSEYYTVEEVNRAELYTIDVENEIEDTLVLNNVMKVSHDEYVCYNVSYKDIAKALDNGLITYNFETQRNPVIKYSNYSDDIYYKPKIFNKTVQEIYEDMINEEFIPNMLTWNILNTGMERFEYDGRKRQLIFTKDSGSQINIIDGYHRIIAIRKVMEERPDFEGHMQIKIFNFDVDKAKKFIAQESKGNKVHVTNKPPKADENIYTKLTERINNYGSSDTNELYHKIESKKGVVLGENSKYVYAHTFADSIEYNFADILKNPKNYDDVFKWIVEFFNELISLKIHKFNADYEDYKKFVDTRNNMFTLYITWCRILYGDKNWKAKLRNNINMVDWTHSNPIWKNNLVLSTRDDKRITKKIISLAKSIYAGM